MLRSTLLACLLLLSPGAIPLPAQSVDDALTDAEVEQLREAAYTPDQRVTVFSQLLDSRAQRIQELAAKPRRPGREDDLHDLFEQFTAIVEELNDNLDDYGPRHRDLRKQLPRLLAATDRWSTELRSPADNDAYNVARSLALEGIRDVHDEAAKLIIEQKAWFATHPPSKDDPGTLPGPHS